MRNDTVIGEPVVVQANQLSVYYGTTQVISEVNLNVASSKITAIIGPSGSGKSTLLRCFNRMNDLIPNFRMSGQVLFEGHDLYAPDVDPTTIRSVSYTHLRAHET